MAAPSEALTHEFNEDRSRLILTADEKTRAELREIREDDPLRWGTEQCEIQALEGMLANSELDWIDPSDTGDLTDAPMLGIVGGDDDLVRVAEGAHGVILGGRDGEGAYWYPILERWAYMPYAVRSFLEDLRDDGEAVFVNSS